MSGRSTEQGNRPTAEQDDNTRGPTLKRELKKQGGMSRSPKTLSTAVKR